ncbi:MAG: hypothetical protein OXH75_15190 [Acidobacteria bacterium]|nr:hypothetical protein [Acidobacteriota bacterium]
MQALAGTGRARELRKAAERLAAGEIGPEIEQRRRPARPSPEDLQDLESERAWAQAVKADAAS